MVYAQLPYSNICTITNQPTNLIAVRVRAVKRGGARGTSKEEKTEQPNSEAKVLANATPISADRATVTGVFASKSCSGAWTRAPRSLRAFLRCFHRDHPYKE